MPVNVIRNFSMGAVIQQYSLQFVVSGGVTVCGPGGVPVGPRVLYGYPEENLVALTADQIVRTDDFGQGSSYTRTAVDTRRVADVLQRANLNLILDTFGRCQFGSQVVEAPDPTYGGYQGGSSSGGFQAIGGGQHSQHSGPPTPPTGFPTYGQPQAPSSAPTSQVPAQGSSSSSSSSSSSNQSGNASS